MKCYRCPKEECKQKSNLAKVATAKKIKDKDGVLRNPDGHYCFLHIQRGFSNIRSHFQAYIGVKESLELVEEAIRLKKENESATTQMRLTDMPIMRHLKARIPRDSDKIIYEFVTMVVDKNQPLTNVDDDW